MTEVIEQTENKKGYKKTKLGWIPEDWDIKYLGDLCKKNISNGIFNNPNKVGKGYKLINVIDLYSEPNIKTDDLNLLDATKAEVMNFSAQKGDIFFTRSSLKLEGIAHCNIFESDEENILFECHIMKVHPKKNEIIPKYLNNYCKINISRKYFMQKAKTTTMTTIDQQTLSKLLVVFPSSIKEQEKITEILSAWDDGIETLEKLIEQKEILKTSLAQKYFQRKNNLFPLKQQKLEELFTNRKETNCCDLELLSVCDGLGIIPRSQLNAKDNSNEDKSKYLKVCIGDLAYNTMRMWQGRCGVSSYEGIVSPAYTVCIPKDNIDVDYMYYLFKTPHMIHDFWRYSQGIVDDTLNLKFNNFKVIKVWIPDKGTQTKIAKLLKSYDEEIQLLNSKLEKLKEQKKGLMQKLLTGQIRVKI